MAAKRTANSDLNHDNWDNEDEAEEAGTFAVANPEVLKDRVIKKAKRRGVATDGGAPSVFAGFGGFKTASTTSATTTAAAGAFDFLASDGKNGSGSSAAPKNSFSFTTPDKAVSDGAAKSVAPVFAFGTGSAPRDPAFGAGKPAATGFSFGAKSASPEPEKKSTFAFGEKSEVKSGFAFGGEKPKMSETGLSGFPFGKNPSNEPSKPPAFLFGEKSSTNEPPKPSGFGFGDKSDSAAKPSFSFGSGNKTDSPKTGFTFGAKSGGESSPKKDEDPKPSLMDLFKPKAGSWTCSVCDVTNDGDKSACVACTTPNPAAAASPAPAAKKWECPSCMVYNEADKENCVCCETAKPGTKAKPSTGFGGGIFGSGVSSGSGFKFGVTPATESSTALGFKFGDSSSSTKTNFGDSAKPSGFQFGTGSSASSTESGFRNKDSESSCKKTEDKEYPKEFLSSLKSLNSDVLEWVKTHVERNAYVYLSPVFKDYENHLSELKAKYKVTSTASVASAPTTTSKPVETGFKFGNGSASTTTAPVAPSFSFGSTDKKKDSFTFGSGSSGSTLEPAKTGFTFGSGSFGSVGGSTTTFGSFGSAAAAVKPPDAKDENDDDENDEPPKVEVAPVVEEDSIYSVRCKLFYKKGKEFADKGLGMMHLKPVEGTKKTQILVRAETSLGNILLNVMLNNQMSLLKRNNNIQFVCVPNPPIPGLSEGPVTMLVKVKNAEMADELEAKMKERLENE